MPEITYGGPKPINWRLLFFTIIVAVSLPLVICIYIPILLFRHIGTIYVKYLYSERKNILKILSTEAHFLIHDKFKSIPRYNIINCWIGEGQMSIDSFRKLVTTNIVERKIRKDGQEKLEYPELKCYPVAIGGYLYWKKISNFDIKNYVRVFDWDKVKNNPLKRENTKTNTEKQVKEIIAHLISAPWNTEKSPWEFWVINNVEDKADPKCLRSVALFRIHHGVADGYSILNIKKYLSEGSFTVSSIPKANSRPRKINDGMTSLKLFLLPLRLPYEIALVFDQLLNRESHCWTVSENEINDAGAKYLHEWSTPIPVETVKTIKNKFDVSFNAVLNSVVAGAVQNLMKSVEQTVPQNITSLTLAPLPGHPGGLNNYFGLLLIRLPVGEPNSQRRLFLASEELKKLAKTTFPYMSFLNLKFLTTFPNSLTKHLCTMDLGCSMVFSVFPGLDGSYKWGDHKTVGGMFTLGASVRGLGATITAFSCVEHIRFSILIDEKVYPSDKALQAFDGFVQKEIQALMEAARAN